MQRLSNISKIGRTLSVLLLAAAATPATAFQATGTGVTTADETLDNATVLKLIAAGVPDEVIIAKIRASKTAFDLSADSLIALKSRGVSGSVLAAMLAPAPTVVPPQMQFSSDSPDFGVPHYPGVYMFGARENRMIRMMATSSNQAKTGGIIGYALTGGIASASVKATIPGAKARVSSGISKPVFYFFFDESVPRSLQGNGLSVWTTGAGALTTSPSELSLVRFAEKPDAREARVGSLNIAGAKQGVMDKDRIPFTSELVAPGVFKVSPGVDLPSGQYGFIQSLTGGSVSGGGGALTARLYDFGVVP